MPLIEVDYRIEAACAGASRSPGQKCTATRPILVQDEVYVDFRERFLERAAESYTEFVTVYQDAALA
jgi:acyl-CoA reductase-like NAD-dependent aldehyde dehydrogenase